MSHPENYIWKFVIPHNTWVDDPDDPCTSYQSCVTAVIAPTESAARERLNEYAQLNGISANWIRVAKVVKLAFVPGTVITWHS